MSEKIKYWLNVDFPTSICTVHTVDCYFKPRRTRFKGVKFLDSDGGWMPFPEVAPLKKFWISLGKGMGLRNCRICNPT